MFDIFDDLFDMNQDGKLDSFEETAAFAMMASLVDEAESNDEKDVFGDAGLDYDELEMMDPEERDDALEAAGLDPLDFDF